MKTRLLTIFWIVLVAAQTGLAQTPKRSETLTISGLVEHPLTLSIDSLRALPLQSGGPINIVGSSGQVRKTFQSFRGVLLRDLLDKVRIQMPNQKDKGKYYIVARATDGYTAIFSHNELFNNPTGKQVIVLIEENGQPIADDGAFVLLTADDIITGARHVKWLSQIEVRKVE